MKSVIRENRLPESPKELIAILPQPLKKILFNQWHAKQNPVWHPEGNTLKHILVVLQRAYHHYADDPNMIMAALFHDLGKMDTYKISPKTGLPTAHGHENISTNYIDEFGDWIKTFDGTNLEEIKYLVSNHMKVKPSTWDLMKDKKKEIIIKNPSFDKLLDFTKKLDGGGRGLKVNEDIDKFDDRLRLVTKYMDEYYKLEEVKIDESFGWQSGHYPRYFLYIKYLPKKTDNLNSDFIEYRLNFDYDDRVGIEEGSDELWGNHIFKKIGFMNESSTWLFYNAIDYINKYFQEKSNDTNY